MKKINYYYFVDDEGKRLNDEIYLGAIECSNGFARVREQRNWFYINAKGNRINQEEYQEARDFFNGLALVRNGSTYHFINERGENINRQEYEDARDFTGGIACVKQDGKWFYIDRRGDKLTQYRVLKPFLKFQEGDIVQEVPKENWRNESAKTLLPTEMLVVKINGFVEEVK